MAYNKHLFPVWELRFRVNKFTSELVKPFNNKILAYGMRKSYILNNPGTYNKTNLFVRKVS